MMWKADKVIQKSFWDFRLLLLKVLLEAIDWGMHSVFHRTWLSFPRDRDCFCSTLYLCPLIRLDLISPCLHEEMLPFHITANQRRSKMVRLYSIVYPSPISIIQIYDLEERNYSKLAKVSGLCFFLNCCVDKLTNQVWLPVNCNANNRVILLKSEEPNTNKQV